MLFFHGWWDWVEVPLQWRVPPIPFNLSCSASISVRLFFFTDNWVAEMSPTIGRCWGMLAKFSPLDRMSFSGWVSYLSDRFFTHLFCVASCVRVYFFCLLVRPLFCSCCRLVTGGLETYRSVFLCSQLNRQKHKVHMRGHQGQQLGFLGLSCPFWRRQEPPHGDLREAHSYKPVPTLQLPWPTGTQARSYQNPTTLGW